AEILLVEDEPNARKVLAMSLRAQGHQVTSCADPVEAEQAMAARRFDLVLTDLRMQGEDAGLEVLRLARRMQPDAPAMLLTAYASAETAVAAMKQGAFDYLTKPVSTEELAAAIERALAARPERRKAEPSMPDEEAGSDVLIGESEPMRRVRQRLMQAARSDFTVLITGESGTGKELAARFVHDHSRRASGPFVPVHCGAIPEGLFESELFGHAKGAFTGAEHARTGLIEAADGGTLFLDEVGEMPLAAQVKLLRALQERRIRRVGEDVEREVDIRVIAATNRDLHAEVQCGAFREDLFFRLNVIPVHLPPLRQRREDIPLLARAMVRKWSEGRARLDERCLQRLAALPLMGNVRELENLLQRMLALSEGGELDAGLLEEILPEPTALPERGVSLADVGSYEDGLDGLLAAIEGQLIDEALTRSGGNVTEAARMLGISFRSLRYRLKKRQEEGA
ncbi:MAG: sigma-54 dependent transcriptional regulator, partial [Mariprofundaceae bacterium]